MCVCVSAKALKVCCAVSQHMLSPLRPYSGYKIWCICDGHSDEQIKKRASMYVCVP